MRFEFIPRELLERCRIAPGADGSASPEDAFEELCGLLQPDLYAFLHSLLRNHDDVDEVLVECLVRLHRHLPGLQDMDKFPGWLMRMAVNQAYTHLSRNNRNAAESLDERMEISNDQLAAHAQPPPSPRGALEQRQMLDEISSAMNSLPPRQRSAVFLYEVEQLPIRDIAAALECSEGAVKFNLHEGRKKLRDLLSHLLQPARPEGSRKP